MNHNTNSHSQYLDEAHPSENALWNYVQSMNPDTIAKLSQPASSDVMQAIERTIVSMLGNLPQDNFNVLITTSRENLGKLLTSAMVNGYFLRNVEQRMDFENYLQISDTNSVDDE
ncbi:DUF760 domain-containing protein [Mastigocoleus sp. MO_188.B34]|uniref:DUF760 domain-containing protein n=1 Tax=Mastigocoleus sp. MO_188.B34 TaxID=3036635 RepID=UPI002602959E|nr:DUF760 domain-containing protein [Mastigocoleus sp. MO_188.B34]MDJ0697978.1 DUF760 domain-containing protein [Mastigocoleus sp. MO_188.B34]